jgi:hypothetical protein
MHRQQQFPRPGLRRLAARAAAMPRLRRLGAPAASITVLAIALSAAPAHAIPPDPPPPKDPCERPKPPPACTAGNPTGTLAAVSRTPSGLQVSGTATDPDAPGPVQVSIEVDGYHGGYLWADRPGGAFEGTVTPRAGNRVCAWAVNRNNGTDSQLGCQQLDIRVDPFGYLDEVRSTQHGLRVRGWAIDPDSTAPIDVDVYVDGQLVKAPVSASGDRPDVGAVYPQYGSAHGYEVTLPDRRHTSVCVEAHNQGPGASRRLGCGRDQRAVSVFNLNMRGTGGEFDEGRDEEWTNDNGVGSTRIPWRERHARIAKWMADSGTLPDLMTLQEVPAAKWWFFFPPHPDPWDYESLFGLIHEIKRQTGAHYRIAYLSPDYTRNGPNSLYQGRALIYNADRLRNTTTLVNSWAVAHDDKTVVGVHMRVSWPCNPPAAYASSCALIDSTSGTDHEGRHWVSSYIDPTTKEWTRGPQAAVFDLVADPGKHIIVANVHAHRCGQEPPKSKECLASERANMMSIRTLVDTLSSAWRPRTKLIPPIVAGDFNGGPDMPTSDGSGAYEPTLPDFDITAEGGIDFVLGGKPSAYPSVYAPVTVADTYPKPTPFTTGGERGYCGTFATVLSDHCGILGQYLPTD